MRWDDGISGSTLEIASIDHSPLRVLAGPGTGKTFSMMRRVLRWLQSGIAADKILVSTFTRTAAKDLRRALEELGTPAEASVKADTLHSLCFSILSRNEVLTLTGRNPRPLMDFEIRFLLQDMAGEELGGIRACSKKLQAFNSAWARLQSDEPGWLHDPADILFNEQLLRWLRLHQAMLIGELVPVTLNYLRSSPAAPERNQFRHVVVDEYQDLNRAEQVLLDLLASAGTLTVIGDENQSIYSFKNAHPEGVVAFHTYHPGTLDKNLTQCRRCPHRVVNIANSLIARGSTQPVRSLELFPNNSAGELHIVQWSTMDEEANGIARFITHRVRSGQVKAGDVLVLAPRRQFGYAVRDALKTLGTDAHSFFNEEELDGNPIKLDDSIAQRRFTLLSLLVDRDDRTALRVWCGFGHAKLQQNGWHRIIDTCAADGISPRTLLESLSAGNRTLPHTQGIVARFELLQEQINNLEGRVGRELLDALFPPDQLWAEPFRSIASTIAEPDFRAQQLLQQLRSGISKPELPTDVPYVRIMSLHKSKGLTAQLVVVVGCIDGLIPFIDTDLSLDQQNRNRQEQRRLFYVAVTRTTRTLVLSHVILLPAKLAYRMQALSHGTNNPNFVAAIPCPFLGELGPDCPTAISGQQFLKTISTT